MSRRSASAAATVFAALREPSLSEIYEVKRRAPMAYGTVDAGIVNAGVIPTARVFRIHSGSDPIWSTATSTPVPSFEFVKLTSAVSAWSAFESRQQVWKVVNWQPEPIRIATLLHDISHHAVGVSNDPPLSMHRDIHASNRLVYSFAETLSERTPDEKRYKELNANYYAGTLTSREETELEEIEIRLDEADEKDPQFSELAEGIDQGYDKLQTGLERINGILDELLKN